MYARVVGEPAHPGQLALQYWFFYVFNDYNDKHEGDWEMIQLDFAPRIAAQALIDDAGGDRLQPARGRRARALGRRQARDRRRHASGRVSGGGLARELLRAGPVPRPQRGAGRRLRRHDRPVAPAAAGGRRRSRPTRRRISLRSPGSATTAAGARSSPASTTARPARTRSCSGRSRSPGQRPSGATRAYTVPAGTSVGSARDGLLLRLGRGRLESPDQGRGQPVAGALRPGRARVSCWSGSHRGPAGTSARRSASAAGGRGAR